MEHVEKEREILNYHFDEIFKRFEAKLDLLEIELAEFLYYKEKYNYRLYLSIYWILLLLFITFNVIEIYLFHLIINIISSISFISFLLFQLYFIKKFPYNYSKYNHEKRIIHEQLKQLDLLIENSYISECVSNEKLIEKDNFLKRLEKIRKRTKKYINIIPKKRHLLKEIGLISVITALFSRIIYDFIHNIIIYHPDYLESIILFLNSEEIIYTSFYIVFAIIILFTNNRKIARSGYKIQKKALKINFFMAGFRRYISGMLIAYKLPKLDPELRNKKEDLKGIKNDFINKIYERISYLRDNL